VHIATALVPAVAAGLAAPAFGQSFVGEWTATAVTPDGGVSETVKVVRTAGGYEITAKAVVTPAPGTPEAGPGTDIVIDGDRFSYKRSLGDALVFTYTGVVSGDTFTGTVKLGEFEVPYKGVRVGKRE
jgi:hypothetical protein